MKLLFASLTFVFLLSGVAPASQLEGPPPDQPEQTQIDEDLSELETRPTDILPMPDPNLPFVQEQYDFVLPNEPQPANRIEPDVNIPEPPNDAVPLLEPVEQDLPMQI